MERPNYKKRSTLPSIIRLLYLTAIASTLLTCIFLWYSKTQDRQQNGSNFSLTIPQEALNNLPQASQLRVGNNHKDPIIHTDSFSPGTTSLELDFDDSFNEYVNPSVKVVQRNLSANGLNHENPTEFQIMKGGKLTFSTSSPMDFEDSGTDTFSLIDTKPIQRSLQQTTPMALTTRGFHNVEFKSGDSMQERLDRVEQYCSSLPSKGRSRLQNLMQFLDQRTNKWIQVSKVVTEKGGVHALTRKVSIQWCPVFKAASTPWMAVLMKLKGYLTQEMEQLIRNGKLTFVKLAKLFHMNVDRPEPYSGERRKLGGIQNGSALLSMLVVRHPFERLLSAYRDKLERVKGRNYYHAKYGLPIVQRFRYRSNWKSSFSVPLMTLRLSERNDEDLNLFPAENVINDPSNNRFTVFGRRASNPKRRMLQNVTPTFNEFVQYLLTMQPAEMDEHWRPMYIDCNACTNSFNLIFKVESMDEDRDHLLSLLGVNATTESIKDELDQIWRRWTNSVGKDSMLSSVWETRRKYFSQLSKQDLRTLYEIYEPDFLMFGYSPDRYLDMTG